MFAPFAFTIQLSAAARRERVVTVESVLKYKTEINVYTHSF